MAQWRKATATQVWSLKFDPCRHPHVNVEGKKQPYKVVPRLPSAIDNYNLKIFWPWSKKELELHNLFLRAFFNDLEHLLLDPIIVLSKPSTRRRLVAT